MLQNLPIVLLIQQPFEEQFHTIPRLCSEDNKLGLGFRLQLTDELLHLESQVI